MWLANLWANNNKSMAAVHFLMRFWIEKWDSGEAIKKVIERAWDKKKPSYCLKSIETIRYSFFCYQKIFVEEAYTLDRSPFEVFLSVYIFQPSIARMPKVRLLKFMLGYIREADEVFKNNSEQQDKWMGSNCFATPPKTSTDKLKQLRLFRLIFLKVNC